MNESRNNIESRAKCMNPNVAHSFCARLIVVYTSIILQKNEIHLFIKTTRGKYPYVQFVSVSMEIKEIDNDLELIQSVATSNPQNQTGKKHAHKLIYVHKRHAR